MRGGEVEVGRHEGGRIVRRTRGRRTCWRAARPVTPPDFFVGDPAAKSSHAVHQGLHLRRRSGGRALHGRDRHSSAKVLLLKEDIC